MTEKHGGNIHRFIKEYGIAPLDFSANINPLGMPDTVRLAAHNAIRDCIAYPDPLCSDLKLRLADIEGLPPDYFFFGNGAADVLYRIAAALRCEKSRPLNALLCAPSFSEYRDSLLPTSAYISYHFLLEKNNFALTDKILDLINRNIDILYLCNPNNPTGLLTDRVLLHEILAKCHNTGTRFLIDECFLDFIPDAELYTLKPMLNVYDNLIILRSFTKMYALPGIRLGYCICSNTGLIKLLGNTGAPWSVSTIAQACGIAALQCADFPERSRSFISNERLRLSAALSEPGCFTLFDSRANFIFLKSHLHFDLAHALAEHAILIRSCKNYAGLDERFFRFAVRTTDENTQLINKLRLLLP